MRIEQYQQVWDIWLQSKDRLNAYVLSRFRNQAIAEDVVQDVLLKMHNACCSGKEINNLNSWLYQITHNASIDTLKKENKQVQDVFKELETKDDSSVWTEIGNCLDPLIDLLPIKYGIPLRLSDIQGIPQKEIAKQLNLGLSATKSRIQRARQLLRAQLVECCHMEYNKHGVPTNITLKTECKLFIGECEKKE